MKRTTWISYCMGLALLGFTSQALGQVTLITDDFEVDSSAMYTVVDESNAASGDGTPDSTVAFAFDYVGAGIPLAPNSTAGDIGGLRFAANETGNDAGAADHITAFNNINVDAIAYELQVDFYMGVESAGGSTEFAHIGVGGDSSDFLSIFTPVVLNGHTLAMTGEGGSASDYRHSTPTGILNDGDASYLNSDNTTNATGDTYQAIFPGATSDFAGSPGNQWATLSIFVTPNIVRYSLNGTPIIQTSNDGSDGLVSLGYADV
ncbi:MAG: hypothetical protein RID07_15595, partial [Lacipirellulaceae bacterium]